MRHLHDLRVRLQQRRNRVHTTDYRHYETELQLFLQFLDDNPYLRALLQTLEATEEEDFEQWKGTLSRRSAAFPPSESARRLLSKWCGIWRWGGVGAAGWLVGPVGLGRAARRGRFRG